MGSVCVVGLGRVGLPTAVLAARAGHDVTGVDRPAVLAGDVPSREPGLAEAVRAWPFARAVAPVPADLTLIAVGTPLGPDHRADLRDLGAAVDAVAAVAAPGALVVIESTVPVGTTDALAARHPKLALAVAPERVLPGDALREIRENPRLVGAQPATAAAVLAWLRTWCAGPITAVDRRTAELAKLVENAARDVELALANTVAGLARAHGVEPRTLRALVNQHPRVRLLEPGIGVGGHCLPVDPWFLVGDDPEAVSLLTAARGVNDAVPAAAEARIRRERGRIGLLGLAYKAGTDDLRESPALRIARALAADREVVVHDPFVPAVDGLRSVTLEEACAQDVVVHLVAHGGYADWRRRVRADAVALDLVGGWS